MRGGGRLLYQTNHRCANLKNNYLGTGGLITHPVRCHIGGIQGRERGRS